jgi:hypothetical protein
LFRSEESGFAGWNLFKKSSTHTSKGIKNIQAIIADEYAGKSNIERLASIFLSVMERPEADDSRTIATQSVYSRIRELLSPCKSNTSLEVLVEKSILEWESLFQKSKEQNSHLVSTRVGEFTVLI